MEKLKEIIINDRRITIREVADDVYKSNGSCHEIFSNALGMKCVLEKFVLKLLNFEQKLRRMEVAHESLNEVKNDAELLKRVITDDGTWVHVCDFETTSQSFQWRHSESSRSKKARKVRSNAHYILRFSRHSAPWVLVTTLNDQEGVLPTSNDARASVFTRHSALWLFFLPKNQENLKRPSFSKHRWD